MSKRHKRRNNGGKFDKSKRGSILYLMVHFPFLIFWKIGITGVGAIHRAIGIDKAVFGFPIPIFVAWIPGAYFIEQALHAICWPINVRFYDGDGSTEWFLFPCLIVALPVMCGIWAGWIWLIDFVLGTDVFSFFVNLFLKLLI